MRRGWSNIAVAQAGIGAASLGPAPDENSLRPFDVDFGENLTGEAIRRALG